MGGTTSPVMALNPFPLPLEQAGEGEPWGLMTGAKALFCLTAGKTEEENGRMEDVLEEPTVGLDDMIPYGEPVGEPFRNPGDPGTPRLAMGTLL